MATRFVHYVLAVEYLDKSNLSQEDKVQLLSGALLPDAVPFQKKKKTHFNKFRWSLGANRGQMEEVLAVLPVQMRRGWELHLQLDKLWQTVCFVPNLYRLPGLLLRYGSMIGKKYYDELSDFDLWVRERLPKEDLERYITILYDLDNYVLPDHEWIDIPRWRRFLSSIREDFTKVPKYQGPPFIGEKSFRKFYELGTKSSREFIESMKKSSLS